MATKPKSLQTFESPSIPDDLFQQAILLECDIQQIEDELAVKVKEAKAIIDEKREQLQKLLQPAVNAAIFAQGHLVITNTARRSKPIVDVAGFRRDHPDVFDKIAEIPVGIARKQLGEEIVDQYLAYKPVVPAWSVTRKTEKMAKTTGGWYK